MVLDFEDAHMTHGCYCQLPGLMQHKFQEKPPSLHVHVHHCLQGNVSCLSISIDLVEKGDESSHFWFSDNTVEIWIFKNIVFVIDSIGLEHGHDN